MSPEEAAADNVEAAQLEYSVVSNRLLLSNEPGTEKVHLMLGREDLVVLMEPRKSERYSLLMEALAELQDPAVGDCTAVSEARQIGAAHVQVATALGLQRPPRQFGHVGDVREQVELQLRGGRHGSRNETDTAELKLHDRVCHARLLGDLDVEVRNRGGLGAV